LKNRIKKFEKDDQTSRYRVMKKLEKEDFRQTLRSKVSYSLENRHSTISIFIGLKNNIDLSPIEKELKSSNQNGL
jgi:hypothetical protein